MKCYPSKPKLLGLLGLTCAMVGLCYWCTTEPELFVRIIGWFGVAFFGLGFIVFPIQFFRTGAQVVIDDEGILDRRQKMGVIRWEDIRAVWIGSIESTRFLCVEVEDPEKYLARRPGWARPLAAVGRALKLPPISIGFSGLRPGLDEVWAHLQAREAASRTREQA